MQKGRELRIALVTPGFSASESDWCIPALLDLVRVLAREHDVEVFALRYPRDPRSYHVYGARVLALGGRQAAGVQRAPLMFRAVRALVSRHRAEPFDVVQGMWADEAGGVAVTAATFSGVPTVISFMGGELVGFEQLGYGGQRSRANRLLVRLAVRRATAITAGSRSMADLVARETGRGPVLVTPLGTDMTRFSVNGSHAVLEGSPPLLQVASLTAVKDHATSLRALAIVLDKAPSAHLHLVGDGPCRPHLESLARALGVRRHVTFHGAVTHDDMPPLYRAARLHVQSSRFESQGMAVIEAAASGCPSAGTSVGVLPELVPEGHLAEPGDPGALAGALVSALDEHSSTDHARDQQALDRLRQHYALERTVGALVGLYHDITDRSRRSRSRR